MKNKIEYSFYELKPRIAGLSLGSRSGVFLRINEGVSDYFPWPEKGEPDLKTSLKSLSQIQDYSLLTGSLKNSVSLALIESEAKKNNSNISQQLKTVLESKSDFLQSYAFAGTVSEFCARSVDYSGFAEVKLKISGLKDLELFLKTVESWPTYQRYILDFNLNIKFQELCTFAEAQYQKAFQRVSYIEDPFLLDSVDDLNSWEKLSHKLGVPFANDFANESFKRVDENRIDQGHAPFLYTIVKPWIENPRPLFESAANSMRRVVVTNQMGHHFHSLLTLKLVDSLCVEHPLLFDSMGLSSGNYWRDEWNFSEVFSVDEHGNIKVESGRGLGWGLDPVFSKLSWKSLDSL